jgi:hypothetical protein
MPQGLELVYNTKVMEMSSTELLKPLIKPGHLISRALVAGVTSLGAVL